MHSRLVIWMFMACQMCGISHADLGLFSEQIKNSEMRHLLGHWQIKDASLGKDGQWQAGSGASWHFYTIVNGHANTR